MTAIKHHFDIIQRTPEWDKLRRGMITASAIDKILTPTLKPANNENTRTYLFELAAQRIANVPEDNFMSYAMERGLLEEGEARKVYAEEYEPVKECGFIVNSSMGFDCGMSPDGLVGEDGLIEVKSRLSKYQVATIVQHIADADNCETPIPKEFMLQVQGGLLITGRAWCDFITYSNGLNMAAIRCHPIADYQIAIMGAIKAAEAKIKEIVQKYEAATTNPENRIHPVQWQDYSEEIRLE